MGKKYSTTTDGHGNVTFKNNKTGEETVVKNKNANSGCLSIITIPLIFGIFATILHIL